MHHLLAIAAFAIGLFGLLGILGNWAILRDQIKGEPEGHRSLIPALGVFGAVAMLIASVEGTALFFWVPLLLGPFCFGLMVLSIQSAVRKLRRT